GKMIPLRKPLVLALLAAGLVAADRVPEAQVFVPELAMLDGALCVSGAAQTTASPPLLIAQAARTEVSPAAKAAAATTARGTSTDQPLISGLGTHSFKITTTSATAQRYFDQGLRLAWNFNHAEAQRAFQTAQRHDPQCVMCYWVEAYVLGP